MPLLAPLLAVLLLAALNPKPLVSVRLLTSRSPALPLGIWLAAGAGGGALLSGMATALALLDGSRRARDRADPARPDARKPWVAGNWPGDRAAEPQPEQPRQRQGAQDEWLQAGPQRGPGEPAPTVTVPFKVLRRPARSAATPRQPAAASDPGVATGLTAEEQAADDWNSAPDEDW